MVKARKNRRKGQSILEYTLLFGVIIAVVIAVIFVSKKPKVEQVYNRTSGAINETMGSAEGHGIFNTSY